MVFELSSYLLGTRQRARSVERRNWWFFLSCLLTATACREVIEVDSRTKSQGTVQFEPSALVESLGKVVSTGVSATGIQMSNPGP